MAATRMNAALAALAGQELVLQELQLHGAAGERHPDGEQQAEGHDEPDAKRDGPRGADPLHGAGILMSFEAGMRMCSRVLATFST
jgi:hypothetical protein